jgi:hypothetical protein
MGIRFDATTNEYRVCHLHTRQRTRNAGCLWGHQINGGGTGKAVGGAGPGYAGTYTITYFDWEGRNLAEYALEIVAVGDVFDLTWVKDGQIRTRGLGRETPCGLVAGIRFLPG